MNEVKRRLCKQPAFFIKNLFSTAVFCCGPISVTMRAAELEAESAKLCGLTLFQCAYACFCYAFIFFYSAAAYADTAYDGAFFIGQQFSAAEDD